MRTLQRTAFGPNAAAFPAPVGSPVLPVLQQESTAEVRAALLATTLTGMPTQRISLKDLEANIETREALASYTGEILPVDTVEFVRAAMGVRGVPEPEAMVMTRSRISCAGRSAPASCLS